jgi:hypothetical protein
VIAKVLGALAVAAILGTGGWLILSEGPGDDWVRILIVVAFFFAVSFLIARVADARPDLKMPLRVTFLVIAVAASGFYVWDTWLRPKSEKNEATATKNEVRDVSASELERGGAGAQPQREQVDVVFASGSFEGLAGHSASGKVTLVDPAGGKDRQLAFDDFEVTQGPDLRVYAVEGDGEVSGDNFKDLGSLKAEKGSFNYDAGDLDIDKYPTIVVWCRAFSTPFGKARLEES